MRSLAVLAAAAAACAQAGADAPVPRGGLPPVARRYRLEDAPAALAPAIARGEMAIRTLRDRFLARLDEEVSRAGPASSLHSCGTQAAALATAVAAQTGVAVGRAGPRPAAGVAPRALAEAMLAEQGRRATDARPAVLDLGDRVGVLRPITLAPLCVSCHGGPDRVAPGVEAAIGAAHPGERATGLAEGDLCGWYWAEVKK